MGYWMNFDNPQTFNEKLQYLKLHDRDTLYTQLVDKAAVKNYIAEKIGYNYIIPTIGVWEDPNDIDWCSLPKQFVLKTTHSGGNCGVVVCKDKDLLNRNDAVYKLKKSLNMDIYPMYREWPYKGVPKKIIAENYLEDENHELRDYKFFCFNGKAHSVMLCYGRETGMTKFYFFDRNWNILKLNIGGKNAPEGFSIPKPNNLQEMFEVADRLSVGFKFVRVDLYNVRGEIYFGEMTFYPASGFDPNLLAETDLLFGSLINI